MAHGCCAERCILTIYDTSLSAAGYMQSNQGLQPPGTPILQRQGDQNSPPCSTGSHCTGSSPQHARTRGVSHPQLARPAQQPGRGGIREQGAGEPWWLARPPGGTPEPTVFCLERAHTEGTQRALCEHRHTEVPGSRRPGSRFPAPCACGLTSPRRWLSSATAPWSPLSSLWRPWLARPGRTARAGTDGRARA